MAAKSLLIVESPAKAKTIQKYLGKDYEVMASKGHIKDLPKRGGVDIEADFAETYVVIDEKGKGDIVKAIREKARKVEQVLLAMDPDREGEAIAAHILEEVKATETKATIRRVLFNEITKKGVYEGLSHPRDIDQPCTRRSARVACSTDRWLSAVQPALAQARVRFVGRPRTDTRAAFDRRPPA